MNQVFFSFEVNLTRTWPQKFVCNTIHTKFITSRWLYRQKNNTQIYYFYRFALYRESMKFFFVKKMFLARQGRPFNLHKSEGRDRTECRCRAQGVAQISTQRHTANTICINLRDNLQNGTERMDRQMKNRTQKEKYTFFL